MDGDRACLVVVPGFEGHGEMRLGTILIEKWFSGASANVFINH